MIISEVQGDIGIDILERMVRIVKTIVFKQPEKIEYLLGMRQYKEVVL